MQITIAFHLKSGNATVKIRIVTLLDRAGWGAPAVAWSTSPSDFAKVRGGADMIGIILTLLAVLLVICLAFCYTELSQSNRDPSRDLPFLYRVPRKKS